QRYPPAIALLTLHQIDTDEVAKRRLRRELLERPQRLLVGISTAAEAIASPPLADTLAGAPACTAGALEAGFDLARAIPFAPTPQRQIAHPVVDRAARERQPRCQFIDGQLLLDTQRARHLPQISRVRHTNICSHNSILGASPLLTSWIWLQQWVSGVTSRRLG